MSGATPSHTVETPPKVPRRNFGLDALRCLAIAMVLANHGFLSFFVDRGLAQLTGAAAFLTSFAMLAIEWLFVLSGFLIGAMMIRSFEAPGTWWSRARDFWLRRWFRTLPNYYLFLVVNILLVVTGIAAGQYTVRYAFFAQNLAWPMQPPYFFVESWTLALDEWFYLLMPLLVAVAALLAATTRQRFVFAAALLIAVPTLARWVTEPAASPPDWDRLVRTVTVLHLDTTGWGVLAAIASRWWPGSWRSRPGRKAVLGAAFVGLGIGMLELWVFGSPWPDRFPRTWSAMPLTFIGFGTFLAFPWVASLPSPRRAWADGVERMSNYTYSLYLAHLPMMFVLRAALPASAATWTTLAQVAVWLAFTFGAAALVHHGFEKPVSDLRERFTRRVPAHPFEGAGREGAGRLG
jgi:peptidoglycan/LPS O-acetylase OafA/YrhL